MNLNEILDSMDKNKWTKILKLLIYILSAILGWFTGSAFTYIV